MSVDEPETGSQETPSGWDSTPTMTTLVPPAALPQEERPLVEFDSPDSGLPSSRNYSVTSAHSQNLSSIDDGQSTEEEGGAGGEGVLGGRQDSPSEDRLCSQLDKLVTGAAAADVVVPSLSSYTVGLSDAEEAWPACSRARPICTDRAAGHGRPEPPQDRQGRAALRPQLPLLHHGQPGEAAEHYVQVRLPAGPPLWTCGAAHHTAAAARLPYSFCVCSHLQLRVGASGDGLRSGHV